MKKGKFLSEIQTKSYAALQRQLQEARREQAQLRLQLSMNRLKDTSRLEKLRHDIARLLMVINQKRKEAMYAK